MKFNLALVASLFAATVAGLAIPSSNTELEAAAIEERDAFPEVLSSASDAEIIISTSLALEGDAATISNFLSTAASGGYKTQAAYKKAANAAYNALKASWSAISTLAEYCGGDPSWQNGNSTLSTIDEIESEFAALLNLNPKTQQSQIESDVNAILSDYYCGIVVPALDDFFTAALNVLKEVSPSSSALSSLHASAPSSCGNAKRFVLEA